MQCGPVGPKPQGTWVGREADEHPVQSAAGDDDRRVIDRATTTIENEWT